MLAALLVALATAAGCGSSGSYSAPPFTTSDEEVRAECLTGTFVPEETGLDLPQKRPPADWGAVEGEPGAMQAERGAVLVTLHPQGPKSEIRLTGIDFDIENLGLRPIGSVFYKPCKRRLRGAAIEADLDRVGQLDGSDASFNGTLGKGFFVGKDARPISFPWSFSLKQPRRLYLVVEAYDIWAKWSARIPWESGSSHGVIKIDNGGRKYEIVDGVGSGWYQPLHGKWVSMRVPLYRR
ncbi:MAG TPA: hypothetical protein VKH20_06500 [Solirubrobacterales bacterium]|nr:hypothetical protein [Solirubrobacterales bacterium]